MASRKKKKTIRKSLKKSKARSNKRLVKKKAKKQVKKKLSRRDVSSFPGLEKRFFSKAKQEYHDIDYADQLTDKEKRWLNSFLEESLGARLNHPFKKIHKKKDRKQIFGANNARNRDIMSIHTKLSSEPGMFIDSEERKSVEDSLIDFIDSKKDYSS